MAIVLGTSPVWRFFVNGAPAYNAVIRFWKNSDRDITQPAYLDAGGTNAVTEVTLNVNGEPANQLYFDDTLTYYITVTNQSNSIVYYEIQGYVPGVTNVTTNFYLQQNYAPNPQFYYHKLEAVNLSTGVAAEVAPPTWFADMDYTVAPTTTKDAVTFVTPTTGSEDIGARTDVTPTAYLLYTKTENVAGQTYKRVYFKIPAVRAFAGQTITLKMDVKASAAMTANLFYQQNLGSGGSGSGLQAQTTISTVNLTTGWTTVSGGAMITALDGLTIGTNEDDYIIFGIDLVGLIGVASGTVQIVNAQMFQGDNDIAYAYSDPFYDTALSLPVPSRPIGTAISTDAGKQLGVNNDGFYALTADSQDQNIIWGGDFDVNPFQEGTRTGLAADNEYFTDGYMLRTTGGGVSLTSSRDTTTAPNSSYNTNSSLKLEITTAFTAGASARFGLRHIIEAEDMKDLDGKQTVLGFWLKVNRATPADLPFVVMVSSEGQAATSRVFAKQFTIATADNNAWVKYEMPISALDFSTGTWNANSQSTLNQQGLYIDIILSAGSDFENSSLTYEEWQTIPAANVLTDAAINNSFAIADTINFALPQMHEGGVLSEFPEQTFEETLAKAQRYYEQSLAIGNYRGTVSQIGFAYGEARTPVSGVDNLYDAQVQFAHPKRIAPAMVNYSVRNTAGGGASTVNNVSTGLATAGQAADLTSNTWNGTTQFVTGYLSGGLSAGTFYSYHWFADARLT